MEFISSTARIGATNINVIRYLRVAYATGTNVHTVFLLLLLIFVVVCLFVCFLFFFENLKPLFVVQFSTLFKFCCS